MCVSSERAAPGRAGARPCSGLRRSEKHPMLRKRVRGVSAFLRGVARIVDLGTIASLSSPRTACRPALSRTTMDCTPADGSGSLGARAQGTAIQ